MTKSKQLRFNREPSKSELRHIATRIWGFCVDFETLREFNDTPKFYQDVISVIKGDMPIDSFSSDYICDTIQDLDFNMIYDTLRYLLRKGIINEI